MSDRPTFDSIYMRLAFLMAERSSCARLQVGCVITTIDHRKVLSVGYNGGAAGLENECESSEPGQCGHLHAEENALINLDTPRYVKKLVYVTHLPCAMCAKRLINAGNVLIVTYANDYRVRTGAELLQRANIGVRQLVA
jgi:dCMP deaminase